MNRIRLGAARLFSAIAMLLSSSLPPAWAATSGASISDSALVEEASWPMVAANPQRTSWTPEEVRGQLRPIWYKPIEPYIPSRVQVIAAQDTLYISTAKGLYALVATTGAEKWVFPTEMPLGNSPTIDQGVAYVGGMDHKLYAIDAATGQELWAFEAGAGFQTNPLVVNGMIYIGNRDGVLYAVHANDHPNKGQLAWTFKTDGPILFSAAYKDNSLYFASNDSYAYAVNATTGQLQWKSSRLPGAGFHSYWPVIYQDKVIFAGSPNYRVMIPPGPEDTLDGLDRDDVYPNRGNEPRGTYVGPVGHEPGLWAAGTKTIDASRVTDYFEEKPWRRTYFVLEQSSGQEYTFDSDGDGRREYAPVLWRGTQNGNRYPPIVGSDGVIYQTNNYQSDEWIPAGAVSGWKIGTQFISVPSDAWLAIDEPTAYSAGGDLIYWNHCQDRAAGAIDISSTNRGQEWWYFGYNLEDLAPGYNVMHAPPFLRNDWPGPFGDQNGVYGSHGDQNPPIPYKGMVYMHRSNAVIAFGSGSGSVTGLPVYKTVQTQPASVSQPSLDQLKQRLAVEIRSILDAGHLRAGYGDAGNFNGQYGDFLMDYWHNPADTIYTLLLTLPYLPPDLQNETRAYIQKEFADYPPYRIAHVGFRDGAAREAFDLPPEVKADLASFGPIDWESIPPYTFYALWKYAQEFGGAKAIFDQSRGELPSPLSDGEFARSPEELNSFIAGYLGYLELESLAGYAESQTVRSNLNRLLDLRASTFTMDTPYPNPEIPDFHAIYLNSLNVARNFMYLTPELGRYLHDHALGEVQQAVEEYERVAPYWFVAEVEEALGENAIQHYYDVNALFQAKALILNEPRQELFRYLDVPIFARGDLFYIQNLVSVVEAEGVDPGPSPTFADVPFTHPYHDEIEALYQAGYTAGCGTNPLRYCPEAAMTRAEGAVFVERGVNGVEVQPAQPSSQTFADLELASWAAKWAEALYADGYTAGCGADPLMYCPWQGHTRVEGAVFYLWMLNGADYRAPEPEGLFADMAQDFWGTKWAEAAYKAGLIPACGEQPLRFCPGEPLSRALAAYMMVQAKGLPLPP